MSRMVKRTVLGKNAPASIVPRRMEEGLVSVLDISPEELARQLCVLSSRLFSAVKPREILALPLSQSAAISLADVSATRSPNLFKFLDHQRQLSQWIVSLILSHEDSQRGAVLCYFIDVAMHSLQLRNYSACYAIMEALENPLLARLEGTFRVRLLHPLNSFFFSFSSLI